MNPKQHKTKLEILALLDAFQTTTLSKSEWCKEQHISKTTISNWIKKYPTKGLAGTTLKFLPVTISDSTPPIHSTVTNNNVLKVEYNGCFICVPEGTSLLHFESILKVVKRIHV